MTQWCGVLTGEWPNDPKWHIRYEDGHTAVLEKLEMYLKEAIARFYDEC